MHRFYLPPEQCRETFLTLTDTEAHHAADVLRLRKGDCVTVLDGVGHEIICAVSKVERKRILLEVQKKNSVDPLPWRTTLLQAIPKGKLIEEIIEKATELGAMRVVPLLTERVTTKLDPEAASEKKQKWQRVAIEAIKQCGQTWLPQVDAPISPKDFLAQGEQFDLSLMGSLENDRRHAGHFFEEYFSANHHAPKSIAIWIGPEGDFTSEESKRIKTAGVSPISLGELVLRCDTAAISLLSLVNYELSRGRV